MIISQDCRFYPMCRINSINVSFLVTLTYDPIQTSKISSATIQVNFAVNEVQFFSIFASCWVDEGPQKNKLQFL